MPAGIAHDADVEPPAVAGAAIACPVVEAGAHVGDRGQPDRQQISCALASARSRSARAGRGDLWRQPVPSPHRRTGRCSIRPPAGALVAAVIAGGLHRRAVGRPRHGRRPAPATPAGRATTASRSAAVGKRLSAQFSWFQPRPMIQRGAADWRRHRPCSRCCSSASEACRSGRAAAPQAQPHDMAVRVDQPGQHRPARAVDRPRAVAGALRRRCSTLQHLAVVADQQRR